MTTPAKEDPHDADPLFRVDDIDDALARAVALGGNLIGLLSR
jgi:hypothetical protein